MCVCFQLFFFPFDGVVDGGRRYHVCVCVEWLPTFFLFVLDDGAHFIFFHVHFLSLDFVCVCVCVCSTNNDDDYYGSRPEYHLPNNLMICFGQFSSSMFFSL
mgnify:CR=1 FL=1